MKLEHILECRQTLSRLFEKPLPFATAEKLCDLLAGIEAQSQKYVTLYNKILQTYGDATDREGRYVFSGENRAKYLEELEALGALEFSPARKTIPRLEDVSPKELFYLREFFDFEE